MMIAMIKLSCWEEVFLMGKQRILDLQDESVFGKNLYNYYEFCSWARWLNKNKY